MLTYGIESDDDIVAKNIKVTEDGTVFDVSIKGEHFDTFVREQVSTGRYANASEVVREALRHLEDQIRLKNLKQLVDEAEEEYARGDFVEWTPGMMAQIREEAKEADRIGVPIANHVKP